jgi:hypothetical protein
MIMKKLAMFFGILAIALSAFSQENEEYTDNGKSEIQTLMGKNNQVGGYGAISVQYTELQDRDAFVFGAKGGIVMGHMMTIGLGGSGFFNDVKYDDATGQDISLAGGYGGFFFEPIIMPKFPVHIAFPILIGAGGLSVVSVNDDEDWNDNYKSEASDAFMVIEPGVEVEMNITRFFRFCVGAYYRYTSDVDIQDPLYGSISKDILRGFSGGVTFKFGRF